MSVSCYGKQPSVPLLAGLLVSHSCGMTVVELVIRCLLNLFCFCCDSGSLDSGWSAWMIVGLSDPVEVQLLQ